MDRNEAIREIVCEWLGSDQEYYSTEDRLNRSREHLYECLEAIGVTRKEAEEAFAEVTP